MPVLPSWLTEPLWNQFIALLPERSAYAPTHPLGCHRPRISDRIVFDKMLQLLRFGCSYQAIADTTCSATTIRNRRDEWIRLGVFAELKQITWESYDRIVGLVLDQIAVDGSITKAPGGGEVAGRSPVDRGKQGLKRSGMTDGYGIPLGRVLAGANRHDSPLLAPTLDRLEDLGPLPDNITVHLDAGYDSDKTRTLLHKRGLHGRIVVRQRGGSRPPNTSAVGPNHGIAQHHGLHRRGTQRSPRKSPSRRPRLPGGPRPRHRSAGTPRNSHLRRNPLPDGCSSDLTKPRNPCTFSARRTTTPFEAGPG